MYEIIFLLHFNPINDQTIILRYHDKNYKKN